MQPDRWQQIERLFHAAAARSPAARAAFLAQACGADAALRAEVEALLAADAENADYLEAPAGRVPTFAGPAPAALGMEGARVGPYRLLRRLGDGGMGAVYLAERADGQFRQRVALKLIKPGMDSADIVRRFRAERSILAALDHPGIARLLDGGCTSDGRPYFVMEPIAGGTPITAYCDRHRLGLAARLRLFVEVCEAVQYAHRNLVIHRDLKPSNVLVSATGAVKLLDFGIAKVLAPDELGSSAVRTRTDVRVMTPEYAAPEQVRGEPVTTATDVYGLGVLLYELLVGQRPYRLHGRSTEEVARVICEQAPPKPSTAAASAPAEAGSEAPTPDAIGAARGTEPAALQKRLRGDLDTIVLKAMAKEPTRRYGSAEALAEDIRRHLDGRPVRACPDAWSYRAAKFVRRYRAGVTAATVGAVLVLGFGIAMAVLAARVGQQAEQLTAERDKAEQIVGVLVDLFETSDPTRVPGGDTLRVGDFLAQGEARVLERLAGQPAVQATMRRVLAQMHMARSRYDRARPLLERALAQQRAMGAEDAETATTLHDLALLTHQEGDLRAARALFRESLALHRRLYGDAHEDVAQAMQDLAALTEDDEERLRLLTDALAIRRRVLPPVSEGMAASLNALGVFHFQRQAYAPAAHRFEETLQTLTQLYGPDHPHVLVVQHNLASVYASLGRLPAAERLHREVLAARRRIVGDTTVVVASSLRQLGNVLAKQGRHAEAEAAYRQSLGRFEALPLQEAHPHLGLAHHNLGRILQLQRRYADALPHLRRAVELYQRANGPDHGWGVAAHAGLVRYHLGEAAEGLRAAREAVERLRQTAPEGGDASLAEGEMVLGLLLLLMGRPGEAEPHLQDARAFWHRHHPPDHPLIAGADCALAGARIAQGDTTEGLPRPPRACATYATWGTAAPDLLDYVRGLDAAPSIAFAETP